MIILDATSQTIEILLRRAVTTTALDWTASYIDVTTTTYSPGSAEGTINGTTAATMVAAPGDASTQRQVKLLTVFNADTVAQVIVIRKTIAPSTYREYCTLLLQPNDTLQYTDGEGFCVIDDQGYDLTSSTTLGISAGTQSASGFNTFIFSNSNNVSFGLDSNNSITMSTGGLSVSFWDIPTMELNSWTAQSIATNVHNWYLQRVFFPYYMTATRIDMLASFTVNGSTAGTITQSIGMYTRSGSIMSLGTSTTAQSAWNSGGATSDTNSYSGVSGLRYRSFGGNYVMTPGEYWIGWGHQISSVGTGFTLTVLGQSTVSPLGLPACLSASNTSRGVVNGNEINFFGDYGALLTATGNVPPALRADDIVWAHTAGNNSAPFRQPYFRFLGSY